MTKLCKPIFHHIQFKEKLKVVLRVRVFQDLQRKEGRGITNPGLFDLVWNGLFHGRMVIVEVCVVGTLGSRSPGFESYRTLSSYKMSHLKDRFYQRNAMAASKSPAHLKQEYSLEFNGKPKSKNEVQSPRGHSGRITQITPPPPNHTRTYRNVLFVAFSISTVPFFKLQT